MKKYMSNSVLFGFYMFYYLSVELLINDLAGKALGTQNVVFLYGAISFGVSIGFLLFPLLRRLLKGHRARRSTLWLAWALNIASLICASAITMPAIFISAALCTTVSAGFIGGCVFYAIAMNPVNKGALGRFFAILCALSFVLQYLVDWIRGLLGPHELLFCVSLYCLCIVIVAYVLLFRVRGSTLFAAAKTAPAVKTDTRKYLWGTLLVILTLSALLGFSDGIFTSLHAGQAVNVSGIPRLFAIPSTLLAGFIYDYKDEKYFPLLTLASMLVLILVIFLSAGAESYNIALTILFVCWPPASIVSLASLTKAAPASAAPDFWVVIGRVAKYAPNGLMAIAGGTLFTASSIFPMAVLYVILMILLLLLFVFQGKLSIQRTEPVPEPPLPPGIKQYGLTEREKEVFEVILQGATVSEMAQKLYISEVTVKRHVGSILKKTSLTSRAELIERYGGNKQA